MKYATLFSCWAVLRRLMALGLAAALAGCGGGGGGPVGDPRNWQAAQFLESSDEEAGNVAVAINALGTGHAVWEQIENGKSRIFSRRNSLGLWESVKPVSAATEDAELPKVVSLPDGEALAVWHEVLQGGGTRLVAARTMGGNWGPAIAQLDQGDISDLQLVDDGQGGAMALWTNTNAIRASHFAAGAFKPLEQVSTGSKPDIAMDASGNALVAWNQESTVNGVTAERIFVRPFVNGTWRGIASLGEDFSGGVLDQPTVAMATGGRAVVAWEQKRGATGDILARIAVDATRGQWGSTAILCAEDCQSPDATMDVAGRATVALIKLTTVSLVQAAHFNGSVWLPAAGVSSDNTNDASKPSLGSDALGRVVVIWRQRTSPVGSPVFTERILSSRFDPSTGSWTSAESVESDESGGKTTPFVAVSATGRALAVWDFIPRPGGPPFLNVAGNVLQ